MLSLNAPILEETIGKISKALASARPGTFDIAMAKALVSRKSLTRSSGGRSPALLRRFGTRLGWSGRFQSANTLRTMLELWYNGQDHNAAHRRGTLKSFALLRQFHTAHTRHPAGMHL